MKNLLESSTFNGILGKSGKIFEKSLHSVFLKFEFESIKFLRATFELSRVT